MQSFSWYLFACACMLWQVLAQSKVCLQPLLYIRPKLNSQSLNNGNGTEWSPIWSVITQVIKKIGQLQSGSRICLIMSMITDRIKRHKVLLSINHNYNKIRKLRQSKTCWRFTCITIFHHCYKKVNLKLTFLGISSRFQCDEEANRCPCMRTMQTLLLDSLLFDT